MTKAQTSTRFQTLAATAALLALAAFAGCAGEKESFFVRRSQPLPPQVRQILRDAVLSQPVPASLKNPQGAAGSWRSLQGFYGQRDYLPVWSTSNGPSRQAMALIAAIPALAADGVDVSRYPVERLAILAREVKETKSFEDPDAQRRLSDLDVELTYTYLSLAEDLATGSLQPEKLPIEWYYKKRDAGIESTLTQALGAKTPGGMAKTLRALAPPHPGYQRLTQALAAYRGIAARGGWGEVPAGPPLKLGDKGPRVAALRARLIASGDLSAPPPAPGSPVPDSYDEAVAAAVSHFQGRHGLEPVGKVGDDTLAELNVPVAARIRQIEVNLERWRWMPASLGDRYIQVNVPDFRLDVVEDGQVPLTMRVIVGKPKSHTPNFTGRMSYVELNPNWNLPDDIAANEIAPKLAADPGYLARQNMELVRGWGNKEEVADPEAIDVSKLGKGSPYRIRQRPGADNSLGQVKFMFPNPFDVYLHGTPSQHLFARTVRSFSHGCVRLEKPQDLAAFLLRENPKWTPEAIQEAIDSGEHQAIPLPRPLPVYILYWTAWVDPDGTVQLRRDLYGHDATIAQALAHEPPVWIERKALREQVMAAK
ncbi:MAG TPA: L,D-transpeptidase family protein [Thermoanaerobaculia bacterium]|nr:L,D-transpeptidase family protein [Thermoanaerobaculia bacterium]